MNWIRKQLTEPTAWLCFAIIVTLIVTRSDTIAICIALFGILMDEDVMKAWCARVAPGIARWMDEWRA